LVTVSDRPSAGVYPRDLEARRRTKSGLEIILRPIRQGDQPRYQEFLRSLSDESVYLKFFRHIRATDDFVEKMLDVDYVRKMVILALTADEPDEKILGLGRYNLNADERTAEVYFGVRDSYQNQGIGRELLVHLIRAARERGLQGLTAQVMVDNRRMLRLFRSFEGKEFEIERNMDAGVFYLALKFK
jgi:ribosomal protein S18 acetylase RimI-like enzyme